MEEASCDVNVANANRSPKDVTESTTNRRRGGRNAVPQEEEEDDNFDRGDDCVGVPFTTMSSISIGVGSTVSTLSSAAACLSLLCDMMFSQLNSNSAVAVVRHSDSDRLEYLGVN